MITCFFVEWKKLVKSKIPILSLLGVSFIPLMGAFFMFILKDPLAARRLGFISTKASLIGTADWPSYFRLLAQATSVGGLIVFGFVFAWIFGREYADRTLQDLLALPIPRQTIVGAKFAAALFWCLFLSLYILSVGLLGGRFVDIPGWSRSVFAAGSRLLLLSSLLTILVSTPVAFFASLGRGYLASLAFTIFTVVLSQIGTALGFGQFLPWAIPALISGLAGGEAAVVTSGALLLVLLTGLGGFIATCLWWRYADHF